jgi:membrane associated rhomboid family serine protease
MRMQNVSFRFGGPITPVVKNLLIINGVIFLIQLLADYFFPGSMELIFGLSYTGLVNDLRIWQIFTYMFLHGGWIHIIFNLLALWMFAGELETLWGSRFFLRYYLLSGTGAGIFISIMNYIVYARYGISPPTIGASGAIYGILLAYGMTWPNREVLVYFLFPIKMKYLVMIFGALEFYGSVSSASAQGGNISHIGHLGGLITGFFLLMYHRRTSAGSRLKKNIEDSLFQSLKKLRLKRKQKKIEERIKAKEIIDDLLEKIARQGMKSLNDREKRNLEWARKHYYPEGHDTLH